MRAGVKEGTDAPSRQQAEGTADAEALLRNQKKAGVAQKQKQKPDCPGRGWQGGLLLCSRPPPPPPHKGFLGKPLQGEPLDLGNFPLHRLLQETCRWPSARQSETVRTGFQTGMASWSGPGTSWEKDPPPTVFLFF